MKAIKIEAKLTVYETIDELPEAIVSLMKKHLRLE